MEIYIVQQDVCCVVPLAIFSIWEKAEDFIKEMGTFDDPYEDLVIEKYEIDIPKKEWGVTLIRMNAEGELCNSWKDFDCDGFHVFDIHSNLVWGVKTMDKEEAVKIVKEKIDIILANNLWGDHKGCRNLFK